MKLKFEKSMKSTDPTAYSPLKYLALDMHCTLKFYTIIYMYAMVAHLPTVECRTVDVAEKKSSVDPNN